MWKKCKIVMLPTDNKASIIKQLDTKTHLILTPSYEWKLTQNWEYQHLYILSDDEIKERDYCVHLNMDTHGIVCIAKTSNDALAIVPLISYA